MTAFAHSDVLDGGLLAIKNGATKLRLISSYAFGDSFATVNTNTIESVALTSADFTLGSSGNSRTLTLAAKTGTATAAAATIASGTATSGSTTTLNDTSKSFTAGALVGKVVHITSGTGSGQSAVITANTATGVTFAAIGTAPDATSTYRINPDLYFAVTDDTGSRVLWVTNETSDGPVATNDTVNNPSLVYTANQPT